MGRMSVLVGGEVVGKKGESEGVESVRGSGGGWEKRSVKEEGEEMVSECKGVDGVVRKRNLEGDGVRKVDGRKGVGLEVCYEMEEGRGVVRSGVRMRGESGNGEVGEVVEVKGVVGGEKGR